MTVSRPQVLRAGDDVQFRGGLHRVEAVAGATVRLVDVVGETSVVALAVLLTEPGFALLSSSRGPAPLPPSGLLDGVPDAVVKEAHWWEQHIVEIITGLPPEHEPTARARPEYDPDRCS